MVRTGNTPKEAFQWFFTAADASRQSRPDLHAVGTLRAIANDWALAGQHFSAGYALYLAIDFAWGDLNAVTKCFVDAITAFTSGATDQAGQPLERLACQWMWRLVLGLNYPDLDSSRLVIALRSLDEQLAQMLVQLADTIDDDTAKSGYLVRGFHLTTDLEGSWTPEFPEFEIRGMGIGRAANTVTLTIQSAFQRFVSISDYSAAEEIAKSCPAAFISPGLRGWKAVVTAFLTPENAVELFNEAAEEFSCDTSASGRANLESWSSINIDLWALYFRARAFVAEILQSPTRAQEFVNEARSFLGPERSGWSSPQVRCFRVILYVLDQIFSGDADSAAVEAREAVLRDRSFGLDESQQPAVDFFESVAAAFAELRRDPAQALVSGRLPSALADLGRIPLIGSDIASAISPAVGEQTMSLIFGRNNTWMYRTIESIRDEEQLQRILLRLMQAQLPEYAQINHGAIEYGKDIVVLTEAAGRYLLQMYQVKAGDITMPVWRNASHELEEMFLVPVSSLQLPNEPDERKGILIFNGHFNRYSEPVALGWRDEQARVYGRQFLFMHIDSIIDWIVRKGLVSELRRALTEEHIQVIP